MEIRRTRARLNPGIESRAMRGRGCPPGRWAGRQGVAGRTAPQTRGSCTPDEPPGETPQGPGNARGILAIVNHGASLTFVRLVRVICHFAACEASHILKLPPPADCVMTLPVH